MRIAIIVLLASFATTIQSPATRGDQPPEPKPAAGAANNSADQLITFGMPVAVSIKATDEVKAEAKRLSKILGHSAEFVLVQDQDPVCCLWIELRTPNPSDSGYVVLVQPGGGKIIATDLKALTRAIDHIAAAMNGHHGLLPVGVFTDYPVRSAADATRPAR